MLLSTSRPRAASSGFERERGLVRGRLRARPPLPDSPQPCDAAYSRPSRAQRRLVAGARSQWLVASAIRTRELARELELIACIVEARNEPAWGRQIADELRALTIVTKDGPRNRRARQPDQAISARHACAARHRFLLPARRAAQAHVPGPAFDAGARGGRCASGSAVLARWSIFMEHLSHRSDYGRA
jgi:hypothetical protein